MKKLTCKCGDCTHWEILDANSLSCKIKCMTCKEEYPAVIVVDDHDQLHEVEAPVE